MGGPSVDANPDDAARAAAEFAQASLSVPFTAALGVDDTVAYVSREWFTSPSLRLGTMLSHDGETIQVAGRIARVAGTDRFEVPINRRMMGTEKKEHAAASWDVVHRVPDSRVPDPIEQAARSARLSAVYIRAGTAQQALVRCLRDQWAHIPVVASLMELLYDPAETNPNAPLHIEETVNCVLALLSQLRLHVIGPDLNAELRGVSTREIVAEYQRRAAAGWIEPEPRKPGTYAPGDVIHIRIPSLGVDDTGIVVAKPGDDRSGAGTAPSSPSSPETVRSPERPREPAEPAPDANGLPGWFVVELMGHRRLTGFVREVTVAGAGYLRVDVPHDTGFVASPLFPPSSVYQLTPTTEETARRSSPYSEAAYRLALPGAAHDETDETDETDEEPGDEPGDEPDWIGEVPDEPIPDTPIPADEVPSQVPASPSDIPF